MKPDFLHLAPETADRLTAPQARALLLLRPIEPTRPRGTPVSVFKALRSKGLARTGLMEREWFSTPFGEQVRAVLEDRGGLAAFDA